MIASGSNLTLTAMIHRLLPLVVLTAAITLPALPAHATEAEAKEVARSSNCAPGKVEVLRRTQGMNGETVYRIACTGQKDVAVIVRCVGRLCTLAR